MLQAPSRLKGPVAGFSNRDPFVQPDRGVPIWAQSKLVLQILELYGFCCIDRLDVNFDIIIGHFAYLFIFFNAVVSSYIFRFSSSHVFEELGALHMIVFTKEIYRPQ